MRKNKLFSVSYIPLLLLPLFSTSSCNYSHASENGGPTYGIGDATFRFALAWDHPKGSEPKHKSFLVNRCHFTGLSTVSSEPKRKSFLITRCRFTGLSTVSSERKRKSFLLPYGNGLQPGTICFRRVIRTIVALQKRLSNPMLNEPYILPFPSTRLCRQPEG
ncbi:hypothetical protein FNJ60_06360 [Bacteroides pyogenes]|uniref:Uncharacterized protein n=1 Tax=Bacteroides pyogenes TaxID=310300 RepID=A0A5D3ED59_9BACE|nr:hypothetical protein FNJ60_06360 [Bacteroides pyogenes]